MTSQSPPPGRFLDPLRLEDVGNGRDFRVMEQFRFLDFSGTTWVVPPGEVVNGASIPRILWDILGGPWSGKYRRGSVVHDYFFRQKKYASGSVHRVFYEAMLTDGVAQLKAKIMYWAVLRFNDSWEGRSVLGDCSPSGKINCLPVLADEPIPVTWERVSVTFDEAELQKAAKLIEATDPSLEEIEELARLARPKN